MHWNLAPLQIGACRDWHQDLPLCCSAYHMSPVCCLEKLCLQQLAGCVRCHSSARRQTASPRQSILSVCHHMDGLHNGAGHFSKVPAFRFAVMWMACIKALGTFPRPSYRWLVHRRWAQTTARAGHEHATNPSMTVTNTHRSGKPPWDIRMETLTAQCTCHNVRNIMHRVLAKPLKVGELVQPRTVWL